MAKKVVKFNNGALNRINNKHISEFNGASVTSGVKFYPIVYDLTGATVTPMPPAIIENKPIIFEILYNYSNHHKLNVTNATIQSLSNNLYQVSDPIGEVTIEVFSDSVCLLKDTQVLLADGTTKLIQDVTYDDLVLTYNPYLGQFIGEYPCVITETPKWCVNHVKRINLANGAYLDIAGCHTILAYADNIHEFRKIDATVDDDSIIGMQVVCYIDGEVQLSEIVSYENKPQELKTFAYNVFVPMHGSIITNNIISGGNFLFPDAALDMIGRDVFNYNRALVDNFTAQMTDELAALYHANFSKLILKEVPINVFTSSYLLYNYLAMPTLTEEDVSGLHVTLCNWEDSYKEFNQLCKVKIDGTVYEVPVGQKFIFPSTYEKYFDTTNYKYYNKGDEKTIYTNEVIIGV